ncbi:MAG: DM13 domain-containing protein [Anaerolineae bacterium]|nr:DM13 domain-containing protein [Anaerolineae bacterium]
MRFRVIFMLLGAIAVALTFTFPLWQPLLQGNSGEVGLIAPFLPEGLQDIFAALPPDQQNAYRAIGGQNPEYATAILNAAMQPPVPAPSDMEALPSLIGPVQVGSGRFERIDAIRWGQGDVVIFQQVDNSKLLRFENFSVANGPSLRVVLSASRRPATVDEMQLNNLDIDLGQLAGTFGNQNYEIPADTDLSQYASIVIYSPIVEMIYTIAPLTLSLR